MSEQNLLRISSLDRDRAGSTSTSDFVVNYKNSSSIQSVKRISIKTVSIPNVFYNVNQWKNTFNYKIAGALQTPITVAIGQYTIDEYKTALVAAGTAIGLSFTLNLNTSKVEITTTTAIEILPYRTLSDTLFSETNPAGELLGIYVGSGAGVDVTSFFPSGMVDFQGETEVYVVSKSISDGSNLISSELLSVPVIISIPITSAYGFTTHYVSPDMDTDNIIYPSQRLGKNLQNIDISLFNREGRALSLSNLDIEIILRIFS